MTLSASFWLIWAVILLLQNFSFTFVSRARNSGSLKRHMQASILSNGVWFASQIFAVKTITDILSGHLGLGLAFAAGGFYTVLTMVGSLVAHYVALKTEKGKSAVGANANYAQITQTAWTQMQDDVDAILNGFPQRLHNELRKEVTEPDSPHLLTEAPKVKKTRAKAAVAALILALGLFGLGTAHAQTTARKSAAVSSKIVTSQAVTGVTQPTSINNQWNYSPNAPGCASNGILANCWSGFTMTITYGSSTVVLSNATLPPGTLSYTWVPSGGLPFATYNVSLVANGYDPNGKALTSAPATSTVVNGLTSLSGPTGLTETLQ
jgi:hypothetical protein